MNAGDKITLKKGKIFSDVKTELPFVTEKRSSTVKRREFKFGTVHKATKTIDFCCPGTPDLRGQFKTFKVKIFQHGHLSFLSLPVKNSLFSTSFH